MPTFFVTADQVSGQTVTLSGPLVAHLHGSLRIQTGDQIRLTEGGRRRLLVKVTAVDRKILHGQIMSEEPAPAARAPGIVLGQAVLKGDHMDWVVQKATELGVCTIAPLVSHHAIVRPRADRAANQIERWQRIALEAAQQSERWDVPRVATPVDLAEFMIGQSAGGCRLMLLERTGRRRLSEVPLPSGPSDTVVLLIGPEGGWRDSEAAEALAKDFVPISLGSRILRAETAAIAAVSIIQSRLGALG